MQKNSFYTLVLQPKSLSKVIGKVECLWPEFVYDLHTLHSRALSSCSHVS